MLARVIATQFPQMECRFQFTTLIEDVETLRKTVHPHCNDPYHIFVYTFIDRALLKEMKALSLRDKVNAIDVLGSAIDMVGILTDETPCGAVGVLHQVDNAYFRRIAAMEFAVSHDDGQMAGSLDEADIVLIGVSRTSKTPLSMYLAHRGYKTANVPLTLETDPPSQLGELDPRQVFGLISNVETLIEIRTERMSEFGSYVHDYATPDYIEREFAASRNFMRKLGCLIINTDNRAIESVAREILIYVHGHEMPDMVLSNR
jgi:regulator of PEP synthase PpsR (kinase-PPPase family)